MKSAQKPQKNHLFVAETSGEIIARLNRLTVLDDDGVPYPPIRQPSATKKRPPPVDGVMAIAKLQPHQWAVVWAYTGRDPSRDQLDQLARLLHEYGPISRDR